MPVIFGNFLRFFVARSLLLFEIMKTFLVLVLSVTAIFMWQRNAERDAAVENKTPVEKTVAAPATPRPVYEHDWAKHSLDRAHAVADQVRETRRSNEQP
jgi:hypothetical protein